MIKLKSLLAYTPKKSTKNLYEDSDQNNNGYPDNSENTYSTSFKRIYGSDIDPDEEEESFEIFDSECSDPFTNNNLAKWEPEGWPKNPNTGIGIYTSWDVKQSGLPLGKFHFGVDPQFIIHNSQLYAGANVSEAYAGNLEGKGLIGKWLENAIPDIVKHYQSCTYIRENYPNIIIKPCLQVDSDESGGYWEKLCKKNGWVLFEF
jgi:hypothetical protein